MKKWLAALCKLVHQEPQEYKFRLRLEKGMHHYILEEMFRGEREWEADYANVFINALKQEIFALKEDNQRITQQNLELKRKLRQPED